MYFIQILKEKVMSKFIHFKTLLQELSLTNNILPTLISNGFDDWDSISELNETLLLQIGTILNKNNYYKIRNIIRNFKPSHN